MKSNNVLAAFVLTLTCVLIFPKDSKAQSPLEITEIDITNLQVTGADSLLATFDLTGELRGQSFTISDLTFPVQVSSADCPILSLSLEIERLSLLGLVVELNDCSEGPVEIDISTTDSGLLGDLLGGLLCGGLGLTELGDSLGEVLDAIEGVLEGVLNDGLLTEGSSTSQSSNDSSGAACDILTLELGAINLDVLGLVVETSDICLFVYAEPDEGLLGDLLCELTNALDSGSNQRALDALTRQILRVISRRL